MTDVLDTMKTDVGMLTQTDIWKEKERCNELAKKSREEWDKLSDDKHEAILNLVDQAMDRIKDQVDRWVPESMELVNGEYLECTFRILFTDLDEEMRRREEVTERRIKRAAKETAELVEEFEPKAVNLHGQSG